MTTLASRYSRGFTLLELVVVLVLLGLAVSIVAANIGTLIPHERLRGAATDIGNMLQFARSEAAAAGANYAVVYDLSNQSYWLLVPRAKSDRYSSGGSRNDEDTRMRINERTLPTGIEFRDVQLGEGNRRTSGTETIEISPMGTASGHIVHLINRRNDEEYSIQLSGLTALVTYFPGYVEFEEVIDYD